MDALELVRSNDHVAQGRSVLQDEHGAVGAYSISFVHLDVVFFLCGHTGVIIAVAGATTVVLPVTKINIALDHTGRRQRDDVAHTGGNVESLGTGKADETEDDGVGVHFVWLMVGDGG